MNYWNIEVNVKFDVSEEDVDDIMATALEGGITYWCDKAKVDGEYRGEWASDQISRGGALFLHDAEANLWRRLDLAMLLLGIKQVVSENPNLLEDGKLDVVNVDGEVADMMVQYGLFGELIYG